MFLQVSVHTRGFLPWRGGTYPGWGTHLGLGVVTLDGARVSTLEGVPTLDMGAGWRYSPWAGLGYYVRGRY